MGKHVDISIQCSMKQTLPVDDYKAKILAAKTVYATGLILNACYKHSKDKVL